MRRGDTAAGRGLSAITPALPLAQAIGRWGNWWNQELFGRPTDLPWALEVSAEKAVGGGLSSRARRSTRRSSTSPCGALFLCGALIWIDKPSEPRGTELFAMYVAGYTFMRFWIERLRVDPASKLWGWRVNEVVSLVVFVLAVAYLVVSMRRPQALSVAAGEGDAVADPDDDVDESHEP